MSGNYRVSAKVVLSLTSSLASPAFAQTGMPYAGIYAHSVQASNGTTICCATAQSGNTTTSPASIALSAYNNPFVHGILLTANWTDIEPLPPGVNFPAATNPLTPVILKVPTASNSSNLVTFTCLKPSGNYCWDTIDEQLDFVKAPANGGSLTTLSVGLDIHAGSNSPPWLSDTLLTAYIAPNQGSPLSLLLPSNKVLPSPGTVTSYSNSIGEVDCATYQSAQGVSISGTSCGIGQTFTGWRGQVGNSNTVCAIIKTPIPWSIQSVQGTNTANGTAPYVAPYENMLSALNSHLAAYVNANKITGFNEVQVVKLGNVISGVDAELDMVPDNNDSPAGYTTYFPPQNISQSSTSTLCPSRDINEWLSLGYDPTYTEKTFGAVGDFAGSLFDGSPSGTATLLVVDVHSNSTQTFPQISFATANNTSAHATFTADNNDQGTYDQRYDGPILQDDLIFCGLSSQPLNETSYTLSSGGTGKASGGVNDETVQTSPFSSGFFVNGTGANVLCSPSFQPSYNSRKGFHWGIQEDGLSYTDPSTPSAVGTYAHAAAQGTSTLAVGGVPNGGFILTWGTDLTKVDGGAPCSSPSGSLSAIGCSTSTTANSGTCCQAQFANLLDSGRYVSSLSTTQSTNQVYGLFAIDLCNPYLWKVLASLETSISGTSVVASG